MGSSEQTLLPCHFKDSEAPLLITAAEEEEIIKELLIILIECLEGVDTRYCAFLLRKFFHELEGLVPPERLIARRKLSYGVFSIPELLDELIPTTFLGQVSLNAVSHVPNVSKQRIMKMKTRSLGGMEEDFSCRLERFKVRTPNFIEIATEEKK